MPRTILARLIGLSLAVLAIVIFMFIIEYQELATDGIAAMAMPLFDLFGGLISALLLFLSLSSWRGGRLDPERLIIVGIAIRSGLGTLTLYTSLKINLQDFEMTMIW